MRPLEIYSKDTLLQKYISGSISREEMHLLNQYALDDDFLFEALEGLSVNEGDNHKNISSLQKNIASKRTPFQFKRLYLMGAAASIALLIFAAVNINKYYNNSTSLSITMDSENAIMMEAEETNKILESPSGISSSDNELSESTSAVPASTQTESKPRENTNLDLPVANQQMIAAESSRESDILENQDKSGLPRQLSLKTIPSTTENSQALKSNAPSKRTPSAPVITDPAAENSRILKKINLNNGNKSDEDIQKISIDVNILGIVLSDESKLKNFALHLEENIVIPDDANLALLNGELTIRIVVNEDGYLPSVSAPSITENDDQLIKDQIQQLTASYPWKEVFDAQEGNYTLRVLFYTKL